MTEEVSPQILLTATGFAAREALALFRKHNIATAPLLLRVVCRNTDLCGLRMKAMASPNACRPLDSAGSSSMRRRRWTTAPLGFTSHGRSTRAMWGYISMQSSVKYPDLADF